MEFSLHLPLFLKMQGNETPDRDCHEEFIFNNKIEREELRNGAICPSCGVHYYGGALVNPVTQKCEKCGVR